MFDLEAAIAGWRQQMIVGIKATDIVNELESHLRDEIEEQLATGTETRQAFQIAVQKIGLASMLENEFEKLGGIRPVPQRLRDFVLTFVGIPRNYIFMNTSHQAFEPRWATYLKTAVFLAPALLLWGIACVFVIPKLQTICARANLPDSSTFWTLTESNIRTTLFFRDHWFLMTLATIGIVVLLEWRSRVWPRYRRATLGFGAFFLNTVVLISIFMMVIAALVAAPALLQQGR